MSAATAFSFLTCQAGFVCFISTGNPTWTLKTKGKSTAGKKQLLQISMGQRKIKKKEKKDRKTPLSMCQLFFSTLDRNITKCKTGQIGRLASQRLWKQAKYCLFSRRGENQVRNKGYLNPQDEFKVCGGCDQIEYIKKWSKKKKEPSSAGEWEINICAEAARSSQAAVTPGSFAVANDVLNGHLWWGERPCNSFLSGKEDWHVGRVEACCWK